MTGRDLATLVLHIPHASRHIPPDLRRDILLSDEELATELLAMTDAHTDHLYDGVLELGARAVVFPVSRLVVDPERFADDAEEPMSERGMGAVYVCTSRGRPLRRAPSPPARAALLAAWYAPHHAALAAAVADSLAASGRCLVVDCHSFPRVALPYESDQSPDRPDVCLGTDAFHTPGSLVERLEAHFTGHGLRVLRDRPFAGSLVPLPYYRRDPRVASVMIEVRRDLYMDEGTGMRVEPAFGRLRTLIGAGIAEAWRGFAGRAAASGATVNHDTE